MLLNPGTLIDGRYHLLDRLGDGAMGQVWRARDTRFESRTVAVKFLREDQTLGDDHDRRERLVARLNALGSARALDLNAAVDALASALGGRDLAALRRRVESSLGSDPPTAETVTGLFDELVNDPTLNENARLRAKMRRLFRDEANSVANLRHDNIVSIFDYGEMEATPYLVMDYIDGRTLHQILEQRLSLSLPRKLRLIEDLCAGLAYAHSRNLVHRDIKPANLIIDQTTDSLKILDFGVVRRLGTDSTVGIPIGTFCYMSPEQTQGAANLDQRSDIFAVGLVFYEVITGRKAFPAGKNVGDLVLRIQRESPAPIKALVPGIPDRVQQIIDKAIAKRPEDRYQDLRDMERDIERLRLEIETADRDEPTMVMRAADLGAAILPKPSPAPSPMPSSLRAPGLADAPSSVTPAPSHAPSSLPAHSVADAPAASRVGSQAAAVPPRPIASSAPPPTAPLAPVAPGAPKARSASFVSIIPRWVLPVAAAAMVLTLATVGAVLWRQLGPSSAGSSTTGEMAPETPSTPAAGVDATQQQVAPPSAAEPPQPASPEGRNTVVIDIRPWARVRVIPIVPEGQTPPTVPPDALYAPFTIDLPPGDYTLEAENGGLNRNTAFQLKVELGKPQFFTRAMPGFSATKIVDALLARE